jgi:hypothetical protein
MEWLGFWLFAAACVWADAWLYSKGHNGFFFKAKTDAEKAIQRREAYGQQLAPPVDPHQIFSSRPPERAYAGYTPSPQAGPVQPPPRAP